MQGINGFPLLGHRNEYVRRCGRLASTLEPNQEDVDRQIDLIRTRPFRHKHLVSSKTFKKLWDTWTLNGSGPVFSLEALRRVSSNTTSPRPANSAGSASNRQKVHPSCHASSATGGSGKHLFFLRGYGGYGGTGWSHCPSQGLALARDDGIKYRFSGFTSKRGTKWEKDTTP